MKSYKNSIAFVNLCNRVKILFDLSISNSSLNSQPLATQTDGTVSYEGAQVWRTPIQSSSDLYVIKKLAGSGAVSLWNLVPGHADFLVRSNVSAGIADILSARKIDHQVIMPDVQRRIDSLKINQENWNANTLRIGHRMNWNSYPSLTVINEYFAFLAGNYGSICKVTEVGKTLEKRSIRMVTISNGNPENKPILITAGQHAREWVAITSAFYVIDEIITNFDKQPEYIKNKDWYIIPIVNPDGFEYTHTKDRLWRKNRRPFNKCYGVDINRNFGEFWNASASNFYECAETYSGPGPFSELESIAVRDVMTKMNFIAYIDLHSFGQMIIHPWSYTHKSADAKLTETARQLSSVIYNTRKMRYSFGTVGELLYTASGVGIDFAYALGIPLSFAIEARDTGLFAFLLPAEFILDTGKDIFSIVNHIAKIN